MNSAEVVGTVSCTQFHQDDGSHFYETGGNLRGRDTQYSGVLREKGYINGFRIYHITMGGFPIKTWKNTLGKADGKFGEALANKEGFGKDWLLKGPGKLLPY